MSIFRKVFAPVLLLLAVGAQAQKTPKFPIERYTLDNGLRVVLSPDHSVPLASVAVGYNVGSRNEVKGKTGFAHLFEHMMFQGSEYLKKGEYFKRIAAAGGELNGTTHDEWTSYQAVVPAEKLPTVLWMEADRMRALAVTAENLQNQKDVVKEEKRRNWDHVPLAEARAKINELTYTNFANSHMTIGSMEDLDAAPLEYVQYFFHTYYVPSNAALVIVGNFDPAQAKALVKQTFGLIPRKPDPPKRDVTEPEQTKGRKITIEDPLLPVPVLFMTFRIASIDSPDMPALMLLHELLFGGKENRSEDIGGGDEHIARFGGYIDPQKGPTVLQVITQHTPDKEPDKIVDEMFVQIFRVQSEPPDKDELNRVKANFLVSLYQKDIEPLMARALSLCEFTVKMDSPEKAYKIFDEIEAVTPEQLQAVAKKYLTRDRLNVVVVKPTEENN